MRNKILALLALTAFFSSTTLWAASKTASTKTSVAKSRPKAKKAKAKKRGSWRHRGQKQIADDRTREIQAALVREGYLAGQPTGVMDTATREALARLQKDNGWQSKIVPDSRALIKLGLGPDQTNVINPESAALASVEEVGGSQ